MYVVGVQTGVLSIVVRPVHAPTPTASTVIARDRHSCGCWQGCPAGMETNQKLSLR
jgi:hypothetical protein